MITLPRSRFAVHPEPLSLLPPDLLEEIDPDGSGPSLADLDWLAGEMRAQAQGTLPPPCEPMLPFAAWIEVQASWYRSLGTGAGGWLAGKLDGLADAARSLDAASPEEFEARDDLMTEWLRDRERAEWDAGC